MTAPVCERRDLKIDGWTVIGGLQLETENTFATPEAMR
jgi:hypothetical protein